MKPLFQIFVVGALACTIWCVPLVVFLTTSASAQVPQMINYQGKLTTNTGALVNDTLPMVFTIYSDTGGTNPLWTETQSAVIIEKGVFNVLLGSVNPIPYSVFDGSVRYLGVAIGGDPEITPRRSIVSVAYAYKSFESDTADYARAGGGGIGGGGTTNYLPKFTGSTTLGNSVIYESGGNVGIGTTVPTSRVSVKSGGNTSSTFALDLTNSTGNILSQIRDDGACFLQVNTANTNSAATGVLFTHYTSQGLAGGVPVRLSLRVNRGGAGSTEKSWIQSGLEGTDDTKGFLAFATQNASVTSERMRISSGGNVGIGTTNPQRALHISDVMRLEPRASAPASPSEGDIYVNSTDHHIYCYLNGVWKQLDN